MPTVADEIKQVADKYGRRLYGHENIKVLELLDNAGLNSVTAETETI